MNKLEAEKATKNGAIAACIVGVMTLVIFLIAIFSNVKGTLGIWNDPAIIFDLVLIFVCAYGIYKNSRFASVLLFCYYIFSKIYIGIELGKVSGVAISIVFLYFFGKAIQGAFTYHKIEAAENSNYRKTPRWIYYTVTFVLIVFFALMGLGALTMTGALPSTEVQAGDKVSKKDRDLLISNSVILKGDKIDYFYSGGFISILEGGTVLTDNRVILYMPDENQLLNIYEIYFYDVASVELIDIGNLINDSEYLISSHDPDVWMKILLSVENRGDVKFIEALRSKISQINS